MKIVKQLTTFCAIAILGIFQATATPSTQPEPATTVVLVHGAFADGSSWNKVIPHLHKAGLAVISVQNPLDSLAGDVAFTNRAINSAKGDVVLVGHSWGGVWSSLKPECITR